MPPKVVDRAIAHKYGIFMVRFLLLLMAWVSLGCAVHAQMLIADRTPELHFRFANDPSFIAAAYDLSGVARSTNNRWGTLVSPNVFLSANHFPAGVGATLVFFATNDPNGPSETRTVLAGEQIQDNDLWIGVLDRALPADYAPLPVIDEPIATTTEWETSSVYRQEVFMVGRSDDDNTSFTNVAVGINRIEMWVDEQTFGDGTLVTDALGAIQHQSGDADFLQYEAYVQLYDSGAPVVRVVDGSLEILGFNWFTGSAEINPGRFGIRSYTGFSYAGNFATSVQAVINAFQRDATSGYFSWAGSAFPSGTALADKGTALDPDKDGLINFLEYAFGLDPLDPASAQPVTPGKTQVGEQWFAQTTFRARTDPGLRYFVRTGADLQVWTRVNLSFDGSGWSVDDPAIVIESATDLGNGLWSLSLRDATAVLPGEQRFLSPGVE